jgi:hypothetical protein
MLRWRPAWRFTAEALVFGIVMAGVLAGGWVLYNRMVNLPLQREEQRLLTVNVPSLMFPTCGVTFSADGNVQLPDGGVARLAEVDLSLPADKKRIGSECEAVLHLIKAKKLGYTITGTDPDGTPVVHLWALSVNEFRGLDDGDEYEQRRAKWLLWRNLSAVLVSEGNIPSNGIASERLEAHTQVRR